ncbi:MAG: type II toxin-antitoxin system RelE/ParE family toxin [Alphaproteobacteria bacterium]
MLRKTREIAWIKAARKDFLKFPIGAREIIATALTNVAEGRMPDIAKPLKGLGTGIFEIALRYRSDAYRAVYAVQVDDVIWIVHAFKKKAKTGIKTPKPDLDLVRTRLKALKEMLN